MSAGELALRFAVLGWGVLCGGVIYEHLAVVPQWASRPPASLAMWVGPYALKAQRFWMLIHPVLLVLLGSSLALGWDGARRDGLALVLGTYVLVLAVTAAWFVPELLRLTQDPQAAIAPEAWRARARRWELLSVVRGVLLVTLAWPLIGALAAQ